VIEADRVLVYLGIFLAAFLLAQTAQSRQRFAEGIAISLALIALLALTSRLLPHVLSSSEGLGAGSRLRYPLGYWNADGLVCGIGAALMLWMSRRSGYAALRWLAVALLPALLVTLYLTYSRGGLLALALACAVLAALSWDRLWLLATLAMGLLGAVPAALYIQSHHSLADNLADGAIAGQGVVALLATLAGVALALALFAGLRELERRGNRAWGRALELSRNPLLLRRIGLALLALLALGLVVFGGDLWHQFSSPNPQFPNNPGEHFTQLSDANRREYWRVALDAFGERPLLGHGAGTYQFSWFQLRSIPVAVHHAHSLYLQAFAELGILGGALVLALVGLILWTGFAAWRRASGPQRELHAALLAVCVAFAVGAALDWFWEIAVLGSIFFLAAGALVAARCAQLAGLRVGGNGHGAQRGYGFAVAGLAVGWIAALALIGPLLVNRELNASRSAAASGELASAVNHADTAKSIEPWAASPYVQLGLLAQAQGEFEGASARIGEAIEREDHNWILYYLRARIENEAGERAAAAADLGEAQRLNPEEKCLREGFETCQ
jgi:tetratricopeptide (TPR) repeat protein